MEYVFSSELLNVNLRYLGILLCLIMSLVVLRKTPYRRDAYHQVICLLFAVVADFFLLYTKFFLVGIMIFWCAHICAIRRYRIRLFFPAVTVAVIGGAVCGIFAGIGDTIVRTVPFLSFLTLGSGEMLVNIAAFFYAVFILTATVATFFYPQAKANNICSRLGMSLFVACDINVLLFNTMSHDSPLFGLVSQLMWIFYLPSQILLSISANNFADEKKEENSGS